MQMQTAQMKNKKHVLFLMLHIHVSYIRKREWKKGNCRKTPFLPPLRALLSAQDLSISVLGRGLDFLQYLEVIGTRAASLGDFLFLEVGFGVGGLLVQETAGGAVEGPEWDADECCVFDGWSGEFVGLCDVS